MLTMIAHVGYPALSVNVPHLEQEIAAIHPPQSTLHTQTRNNNTIVIFEAHRETDETIPVIRGTAIATGRATI